MGDSTTAVDIPTWVDMVAGYVNGNYAWSAADWLRWRSLGKPVRHISVTAAADTGDVLDVERYDALPWEAPGWVQRRRAAGVADPWVYVQQSMWSATRTEFLLRGVPEPLWWIANYDNNPAIPAGAIAKQYANATFTRGHYDLSSVADSVFGGGGGRIGGDMPSLVHDPANNNVYTVGPTGKRHISLAELQAYQRLGQGTTTDMTSADIAAIPDAVASSSAPVEPPEPAEPKSVTGTFTGTLSS